MALDRIDFDLLTLLQNDARMSNKELAAHVGLAPSTCLERVRRLREGGAILGFHAAVDPAALGIGLQALMAVRISHHAREVIERFQAHVLALPEVVAVYYLAGANDFLVHVAVRDADHLHAVALDSIATRPEVQHMETALIFDHQQRRELPNYARSV
jgi:DNA-binding Lrp family transcriptional regulator